jgi:hypothetical protein
MIHSPQRYLISNLHFRVLCMMHQLLNLLKRDLLFFLLITCTTCFQRRLRIFFVWCTFTYFFLELLSVTYWSKIFPQGFHRSYLMVNIDTVFSIIFRDFLFLYNYLLRNFFFRILYGQQVIFNFAWHFFILG